MSINKLLIMISIIMAYIFIIFIPYAWTGIFASIPLYRLRLKLAGVAGFLIGISTISIYVTYPNQKLMDLSNIIGNAIGIPGIILLIIYPLFYAIIMMLSAMLFSEVKK
ncbi:MAG: hypothetical protein QXT18_04840 [Thermoplasmata archaeon]